MPHGGDGRRTVSAAGAAGQVTQWWEFFFSAGFGGLAAVLAAVLATWVASRRLRADRERDRQDRADSITSERQSRWWEQRAWLWDNREVLSEAQIVNAVSVLNRYTETEQQEVFLLVIADALLEGHGTLATENENARDGLAREPAVQEGKPPVREPSRRLESPDARRRVADIRDDLLAKIQARHPHD